MTQVNIAFNGGDRLKARLLSMAQGLEKAKSVRAGFLEDADYPANDGGARLAAAAKRVTPDISALHPDWKPRLEAWAKWQETHSPQLRVAQVAFWLEFGTTTQKPRPFFRHAIAQNSPNWGGKLGRYLKSSEYDAGKALAKMGVLIQGQIVDSIESLGADNAPLTVFIKGFDRAGQDSAQMKRSVDFEVLQ
jgi:hypothetical protein